jgi:hypothetical protein
LTSQAKQQGHMEELVITDTVPQQPDHAWIAACGASPWQHVVTTQCMLEAECDIYTCAKHDIYTCDICMCAQHDICTCAKYDICTCAKHTVCTGAPVAFCSCFWHCCSATHVSRIAFIHCRIWQGCVCSVMVFTSSYVCAHVRLCYCAHPCACVCARQLSGGLPPPSLKILSVAPLLAEVLKRLAADEGFPHLRLSKL